MTGLLETFGLQKRFGAVVAANDISITVQRGQRLGLIGNNGAGKTTFVNIVTGHLRPDAGQVLLDGENIYDSAVDTVMLRRRVGMVFQKPNPFPTMSIRDNVLSGLRLTYRFKRNEADEVVERALMQAALWDEVKDDLHKPGISLSGGQQQRLCIARAVAVEPEVLLMDEPASALDPIATAKIEELIHELSAKYTVVIVTHNMQQAGRCSDYTAFFYLGRLIEFGPTTKIFTNPSEKRTEDYITGRFG